MTGRLPHDNTFRPTPLTQLVEKQAETTEVLRELVMVIDESMYYHTNPEILRTALYNAETWLLRNDPIYKARWEEKRRAIRNED